MTPEGCIYVTENFAAALALDPQIDGERACAMGASYGGFMVLASLAAYSDRLAGAVGHATRRRPRPTGGKSPWGVSRFFDMAASGRKMKRHFTD